MAGNEGDLAHSPAAEAGYRRALDEADALAHEATSEAGVSPIADEPPEGLWRAKECVRPNCARVAQASGARLDFRREYRIQRHTLCRVPDYAELWPRTGAGCRISFHRFGIIR